MTIQMDKSLSKTQCVGCGNYPMLLHWYKNEEMTLPKCCKNCYNMMVQLER